MNTPSSKRTPSYGRAHVNNLRIKTIRTRFSLCICYFLRKFDNSDLAAMFQQRLRLTALIGLTQSIFTYQRVRSNRTRNLEALARCHGETIIARGSITNARCAQRGNPRVTTREAAVSRFQKLHLCVSAQHAGTESRARSEPSTGVRAPLAATDGKSSRARAGAGTCVFPVTYTSAMRAIAVDAARRLQPRRRLQENRKPSLWVHSDTTVLWHRLTARSPLLRARLSSPCLAYLSVFGTAFFLPLIYLRVGRTRKCFGRKVTLIWNHAKNVKVASRALELRRILPDNLVVMYVLKY